MGLRLAICQNRQKSSSGGLRPGPRRTGASTQPPGDRALHHAHPSLLTRVHRGPPRIRRPPPEARRRVALADRRGPSRRRGRSQSERRGAPGRRQRRMASRSPPWPSRPRGAPHRPADPVRRPGGRAMRALQSGWAGTWRFSRGGLGGGQAGVLDCGAQGPGRRRLGGRTSLIAAPRRSSRARRSRDRRRASPSGASGPALAPHFGWPAERRSASEGSLPEARPAPRASSPGRCLHLRRGSVPRGVHVDRPPGHALDHLAHWSGSRSSRSAVCGSSPASASEAQASSSDRPRPSRIAFRS